MAPREPTLEFHGPTATHDQRCAVLTGKTAVYNLGDGCFHPSWDAQAQGYRLVQATSWFQRKLLTWFFGEQR